MRSTKYKLRHGRGRWAQLDTIVTLGLDKGKLTAEHPQTWKDRKGLMLRESSSTSSALEQLLSHHRTSLVAFPSAQYCGLPSGSWGMRKLRVNTQRSISSNYAIQDIGKQGSAISVLSCFHANTMQLGTVGLPCISGGAWRKYGKCL